MRGIKKGGKGVLMRGREGRKRRRGEGGDSKCERATEGVREGRRGQGKRRRIEESREMGWEEEDGAPSSTARSTSGARRR